MTIANAVLNEVVRDPLAAARRSGRPVVMYVSNNVPVELIYACGCFPLQLPTAPRADYARADIYLEPHFEPMVRSALDQLLCAELDCASLLVLPRTLDAWQRLYYYLCELSRRFGEQLPEPFLYDLQALPTDSSARYNEVSTELLADKLSALSGTTLSSQALSESIALYDRIRDKLTAVMRLRRQRPCQLAGVDALELYTAAQRLDPRTLEQALDQADTLFEPLAGTQSLVGARTLLIGSAHDTPTLHQMIANAGGQVVYDFHYRGDWTFGPRIKEIDEDENPIQALSQHYHRQSLSARSFPSPVSALVEAASSSQAEAAIFFYYDEEEALTWDYPAQAEALRARGVRSLLLGKQAYPPSAAAQSELDRFFAETSGDTP